MMVQIDSSTRPLQSIEDPQGAVIRVVRLSLSDQHGMCRSKELSLEVFAFTQGSDFMAAIFSLELARNVLETPGSPFDHTTGNPDMLVVARREMLTRLPCEQDTAWGLGDIAEDCPQHWVSTRALFECGRTLPGCGESADRGLESLSASRSATEGLLHFSLSLGSMLF